MSWRSIRCSGCGGQLVAQVGRELTRCRCCGSEHLVESPRLPRLPERYRPFQLDEDGARAAFDAYRQSDGWHHPSVAPERLDPLFVPVLRFEALVTTHWSSLFRGKSSGRAQRIESGTDEGSVAVTLPTSAILDQETWLELGSFDDTPLDALPDDLSAPFEVGRLHGQRSAAREALHARHMQQLGKAYGTSSIGELTVHAELTPVFIAPYVFRGSRYRVVINGVTGACSGPLPLRLIGFGMGRYGIAYDRS